MKRWVFAALAAATALSVASAASAAQYLTLSPTAPDGSISGVFGNDGAAGTGTFTDTFNFTWPSNGNTAGSITTSATKVHGVITPSTNIDFISVTLDGTTFALTPTGQFESGSVFIPTTTGPQTLIVKYKSGGAGATYSGTIAFTPAAVPEPTSWALMIAGFAGLGVMLRTRRTANAVI